MKWKDNKKYRDILTKKGKAGLI